MTTCNKNDQNEWDNWRLKMNKLQDKINSILPPIGKGNKIQEEIREEFCDIYILINSAHSCSEEAEMLSSELYRRSKY